MKDVFNLALSQYGLKEVPGTTNNPLILKFFAESGHKWVQDDETAWCSAFVNWCAKKCGYEFTGKLNARSWLNIGWQASSPEMGDLAILWRESPMSWKGHVGFVVNIIGDQVYVLGGNQRNQVNVTAYPLDRVIEFRRLRKL